jgi:hypothetical protein
VIHFGWKSCNVLYVDSSSGNAQYADVSKASSEEGISLSSSQKFIEGQKEVYARVFTYVSHARIYLCIFSQRD